MYLIYISSGFCLFSSSGADEHHHIKITNGQVRVIIYRRGSGVKPCPCAPHFICIVCIDLRGMDGFIMIGVLHSCSRHTAAAGVPAPLLSFSRCIPQDARTKQTRGCYMSPSDICYYFCLFSYGQIHGHRIFNEETNIAHHSRVYSLKAHL